ncbi:hypothetical protein BGZ65_006313 [Modicella reniformis]|uniref:RRM domain-containing protein n=1 Tax=Modicella reniformis TaxID=1440133 RepID=A0A9P6MGB6_9FUNG|nr:hypothetical protein BGZ65_006313 [Modicella reniformis]
MTTRVYLGHLARDASDRDIEVLFKNYGRIREVTIKNGFGFVEFHDPKDAEDVVYEFHGKDFMGERLVVELARGERRRDRDDRDDRRYGPPERTEFRLIVENLAHGVSWQCLDKMMSTWLTPYRLWAVCLQGKDTTGNHSDIALFIQTWLFSLGPLDVLFHKDVTKPPRKAQATVCFSERAFVVLYGPPFTGLDIKDLMRKAGEVTFADLNKERDDEGVVEFSSEKDVQMALKTLNGENLRGKAISLRLFDPARDTVPRDLGGRGRDRYDVRDRDRDRRDRFDGREERRDRGRARSRSRSRDRDRGGRRSRSRDRDRRRSRSRDRAGRSERDREHNRERGGDRERDRGRDKDRDRERPGRDGGRRSRSPGARSKSPVRRRSRSASRD